MDYLTQELDELNINTNQYIADQCVNKKGYSFKEFAKELSSRCQGFFLRVFFSMHKVSQGFMIEKGFLCS